MGEWKKTACVLCAQNCGLEVRVEDNKIVKSRPDKANWRSEGYVCRKGLSISHYQHNAQRLTHPLKRVGDEFVEITWDQAIKEIAGRLREITQEHGPRSLAFVGAGGQGSHFEGQFGRRILSGMDSQYHYTSLSQELTGHFWVGGRFFGRQSLQAIPDEHHAEVLVALGWNGWMSHQIPQARRVLKDFSKNPDKLLISIDPHRSETARRANIHVALRPGTDALLLKSMIAILLENGQEDAAYLAEHTHNFDTIAPWFKDFDYQSALQVCELEEDQVREVCDILAARPWSMHADLGVLMNRHSTSASYLYHLLMAICGRIGVKGGNVLPGELVPLTAHSDERDPAAWRTVATDFPAIMGIFPAIVLPEEILSDNPQRTRAAIVNHCNPLRSWPDTKAFEKAFGELELLVTCEIAMSETAALSHYVLPAASAYEAHDTAFFLWNWPEVFFQMRKPVLNPEGEQLEAGEIFTRLARELDLIPAIPDSLRKATGGDRGQFREILLDFLAKEPEALKMLPLVMAELLGDELGSHHLAALWGLLATASDDFYAGARRAGFGRNGDIADEIYQTLMSRDEGAVISCSDPDDNFSAMRTEDGRIDLFIPELAGWIQEIVPATELEALMQNGEFPMILSAGRHIDTNSNTQMRNPSWNLHYRACTVAMHPTDAEHLGLSDGQQVQIFTEAGSDVGELEITEDARPGTVMIPHGFGLVYKGEAYGINVNNLTSSKHRDAFAGTPFHRWVPCRVEDARGASGTVASHLQTGTG